MNIEECYNRMGGDYAQVLLRLPSGALVKKFITKFLDDGTYQELCRAMEQGDRELAFRAAHTLKGMMRQVCDRGGAIFFSTHVLEVAEKLCDKVAIIKGGRLIRSGTMEEVKGDESLEDVFLELEGEVC